LPAANAEQAQSTGSHIWGTLTPQRRSNLMIESNHSSSTQANSKTHDNIFLESYAPSLRVIGQALETLRFNAFKLENSSDKYIARDWEPGFLKNIADEVSGLGNSGQTPFTNKQSSDPLNRPPENKSHGSFLIQIVVHYPQRVK
jgi:hypothetical protein